MGQNLINKNASGNESIVTPKENEKEPLIQNPNILIKKDLQKLSDKMAQLKDSLATLKNVKHLSETPLTKKKLHKPHKSRYGKPIYAGYLVVYLVCIICIWDETDKRSFGGLQLVAIS